MKFLKENLIKIWKDESAQGATEYILILVVIVGLVLIFRTKITEVITAKIDDLGSQIQGLQ